jgi:hypothetical protein
MQLKQNSKQVQLKQHDVGNPLKYNTKQNPKFEDMVEHDANMPNVDASNEMEHVSQVTRHVSNVLDDV